MKERFYFLNPVTILLLIPADTVLLLFGSKTVYLLLLALSFAILFFSDKKIFFNSLVFTAFLYSIMSLIGLYMGGVPIAWIGALYAMLFVMIRLMPVWMMAFLLSSHTSSELMHSLRRLYVPVPLTIGIAVFFRFIPEFKIRLKEIREGAKIRGFYLTPLHPVRSFELLIVPLMFRAISVSDTLSCSILTKGIEYTGKKTPYRDMPFTWRDFAVLVIFIILTGVSIWKAF